MQGPNHLHSLVKIIMLLTLCVSWSIHASPIPPLDEKSILSKLSPSIITKLAPPYDAQGALQRNRDGYFSVRFQDGASWIVVAGLLQKNIALLDSGIRAYEYAFSHQNPDGSFPIIVPASLANKRPYPQDYASAVTFFLSDVGRALLLLEDDVWFQSSDSTKDLRQRMNKLKERAELSLDWVATQNDILVKADFLLSNHLFYNGVGLYLTGRALGKSESMIAGQYFTDMGLGAQWNNGVLPENNGYDSSYQGVSLLRLITLFLHTSAADSEYKQKLWYAIESAAHWEKSRILPSGEISAEGNSRVFPGGDKFLGVEKGLSYQSVALSFYYYGLLAGDSQFLKTAGQVVNYYSR